VRVRIHFAERGGGLLGGGVGRGGDGDLFLRLAVGVGGGRIDGKASVVLVACQGRRYTQEK